jgi:hypothetical protein
MRGTLRRYADIAKRIGCLGLLLLATACASGASPGAMTVPLSERTMLKPESRLRQTVGLGTIAGGRETNPMWMSDVSSADLATALRQTLTTHAMLAINAEAFRLEATLIALDRPIAGFDMTVTSRVQYRVTRVATGGLVFDREITAPFTATFSSSAIGVERLRLANEGSIRENIRLFLEALLAEEAANPAAFGGAAGARIS